MPYWQVPRTQLLLDCQPFFRSSASTPDLLLMIMVVVALFR